MSAPSTSQTASMPSDYLRGKKVILVATHLGTEAGGEAMKAHQYAEFLKAQEADLSIILHQRSFDSMGADPKAHHYLPIQDTWVQRFFWRVPALRLLLEPYFHIVARRLIKQYFIPSKDTIVHYIAPISPVTPRFPPRGFHIVIGPVAGNIYYPPAFADRMPRKDKLRQALHTISQRVLGVVHRDKRKADKVLNSGYDRTRVSLNLAGCTDGKIIDVADSGVNPEICALPRMAQSGENPHFMCSGRLIDLKAYDLAIRALARTASKATLTIYGTGAEMPRLQALVAQLSLQDRVHFRGWVNHTDIIADYPTYRGYLFPSLADSNGIVMQEAMVVGLPVIALRWGGPAGLADDTQAMFVDPVSAEHVIDGFAKAMDRLAQDGAFADTLSCSSYAHAQANFTWADVSRSWMQAYR